MKKYFLLLSVLMVCVAVAAYADFYTWEDEDGTTHISDYPPPQKKNIKVYKDGSTNASDAKETGSDAKAKDRSVILFTRNECMDCIKAVDFLNSRNIKFTEYNLDSNKNAAAKRSEFDQNTDVPFAVINRTQVYGFSEAVYERALKAVP